MTFAGVLLAVPARTLVTWAYALGTLGGILIALGAYVALTASKRRSHDTVRAVERASTLLGSLLIVSTMFLQVVAEATGRLRP